MFRTKLKIDPQVLQQFYTRVKTGVRGLGFVRTKPDVEWPADLQVKLPKPPEAKAPDDNAPQARRPAGPATDATMRPKRKRPTQNDRRAHRAGQRTYRTVMARRSRSPTSASTFPRASWSA